MRSYSRTRDFLRCLRRRRGLSLKKVAGMLGVSQNNAAAMELYAPSISLKGLRGVLDCYKPLSDDEQEMLVQSLILDVHDLMGIEFGFPVREFFNPDQRKTVQLVHRMKSVSFDTYKEAEAFKRGLGEASEYKEISTADFQTAVWLIE
jgi:hypothetical protein